MPETPKPWYPNTLLSWVDLIVKTGAVFAVFFGIHQYLEARQDRRVETALSYVTRFSDPKTSVGQARNQITNMLWAHESQIERLNQALAGRDPVEAAALRNRFIQKLLEGGGSHATLRDDLTLVVEFFDALHICVEQTLCDGETSLAFFSDYLRDFSNNFRGLIEDRQRLDASFGRGFHALLPLNETDGSDIDGGN